MFPLVVDMYYRYMYNVGTSLYVSESVLVCTGGR